MKPDSQTDQQLLLEEKVILESGIMHSVPLWNEKYFKKIFPFHAAQGGRSQIGCGYHLPGVSETASIPVSGRPILILALAIAVMKQWASFVRKARGYSAGRRAQGSSREEVFGQQCACGSEIEVPTFLEEAGKGRIENRV